MILLSINGLVPLKAQSVDPVSSIKELKEGYLLVRMPAFKAKIDTLQSMFSRASDRASRSRLEKMLKDAKEERDTLLGDYTRAFRDFYHFSKVGYYLDDEGRDLHMTTFHNMNGDVLTKNEMGESPVYYLFFERTPDNNLEALVIYNNEGIQMPAPFPNYFARGGINFLFLKISNKKFPTWRVDRINKRFFKYWEEVKSEE